MSAFLVHDMIDEAGILMTEAVVILPPDVRRQQIIQRSDGPAPGNLLGFLQPLGVLVEHGVDDVDEGFVAGKESVAAGEQVAFEPALAHVLAENFQDAAVGRDVIVGGNDDRVGLAIGEFEQRVQAIGAGFIRTEHQEIAVAAHSAS